MNVPLMREYRLSSSRNAAAISCGPDGAFVGSVPLLKRTSGVGSREMWALRDGDELAAALSESYGLPVDVSAKAGGLAVVARALNSGDVARAQIATVLLQLPDPPPVKGALSQDTLIKLAVSLDGSGLLKIDWDPAKHPRYPAKAPDSKGGQFAPKFQDTNDVDRTDLPDIRRLLEEEPRKPASFSHSTGREEGAESPPADQDAAGGVADVVSDFEEQAAERTEKKVATAVVQPIAPKRLISAPAAP